MVQTVCDIVLKDRDQKDRDAVFLQVRSVILYGLFLSRGNHTPSPDPQHRPDPGGHHHSQGSQSEQLPGGDDGQEDVG